MFWGDDSQLKLCFCCCLPLSPFLSPSACAILLNKCAKKCITFSKCQMSDKKPTERGCAALCASHSAYTWQSLFSDTLTALPYLPLSLFLSLTFFSLLISLLLPHSFWLSAWIFNKQAAKTSKQGKNRVCVGLMFHLRFNECTHMHHFECTHVHKTATNLIYEDEWKYFNQRFTARNYL